MDIKTIYVNAPFEEDLVFKQLKSFDLLDEYVKQFVCELNKISYGLKKSGRN